MCRKQATIYVEERDLAAFDQHAAYMGKSRVALIRELIRGFNKNPDKMMKAMYGNGIYK